MIRHGMRPWPWSPLGYFLVFRPGDAEPAGVIDGNTYTITKSHHNYDANVRADDSGPWLDFRHLHENFGGRLIGLTWLRPDGERWQLVVQAVGSRPGRIERITDPDAYRAALDCADALEELEVAADDPRVQTLRLSISLAAFYGCPVCEDAELKREDCPLCLGDGFLYEGVAG